MLPADAGGVRTYVPTYGPAYNPVPAPPPDPKVTDAVVETVKAGQQFGPEQSGAMAYQISQKMADPNLTQAQKDDYIAQLVELSHSPGWSKLDSGKTVPELLTEALEKVGTGDGSPESKALGDQVAGAVGRGVDSGRLDVDDVYALVDPARNAYSDGARQLLSQVTDGKVLNQVAGRLLDAAKAEGYDINKYQDGPALLVAAGDVANMAARHGVQASANAVVREIGRVEKAGPIAGDMTLMQAMRTFTSTGPYSQFVAPGRNGFDVLAGLTNSANSTNPEIRAGTDSIFQTLVRSGQTGEENSAGLGELGKYFNANLSRINEEGYRYNIPGDPRQNLIQDFVGKVMLDGDYPLKEQTATAMAGEMDRLAGRIQDRSLSEDERAKAATGLGELVGSIQGGANDFYLEGKADNDAKIGAIRFFTDQLTGKLSSAAGPFGKLVDAGADAGWGAASDKLDKGLEDEVLAALGPLVEKSNAIREAIGDMHDIDAINDYDQRYNEHVPDQQQKDGFLWW